MSTNEEAISFSQKILWASQACDAFVYRRFKVLGEMIHDFQRRFLFIPLLLMLPLIAGMSTISDKFEDDPRKLYVPEDTQASRDEAKILANFGLPNRGASVYGVTSPEGDNMLTTSGMLAAYDLWSNITANQVTYDDENYNLTGVCVKLNNVCQKSTILAFWQYNRSLIASSSDSELWQTIVDANYTATEEDGRSVSLETVAYRLPGSDSVLSTRFLITLRQAMDKDSDGSDERCEQWELGLRDLVKSIQYNGFRFYSDSREEITVEASAPFDNDLRLLPVGYFLLVIYATMVLSRNSTVHTHGSLALISFFAVCVAIVATFGLGLWFQIPFSSMVTTLAFLLLGLGTDDTFVLVAAFQHPEVVQLEPRERVAEAMSRAGSSISVTSITDLIAFLAGSYCSIPVVRQFCQYAAIGVTLDFFLQVTFFAVCMYYSGMREDKEKLDWLCCVLSSNPEAACVGKGSFDKEKREVMTTFLEDFYVPRLLTTGGKIVALGAGIALLSLGIWACTKVTVDFEYDWFVPTGSYINEMFAVRDRYWGSNNLPSSIYTFPGEYSSNVTQVQFAKMTTALNENDMLVPDSCVNWWPSFIAFAEVNATSSVQIVDGQKIVESSSFDDTLSTFYYNSTSGASYNSFLQFSDTSSRLLRSRIACLDDGKQNDMTYRTKQMDRMRDIASIAVSVDAVAFGPTYWVQDAHKIFLREIVINLACALAGVFTITTLMLGSLKPSLLVTMLLIVIDVEVLGSIYLSGDYFNTVTGINLVLAVGLSVDAVAHITHSFLAHDGSGNERSGAALVEIGRSVFNGAISTMIVLLPLYAAQTYVFQVFFRTFMAIIGYSAFNGLVVLPVLLSWMEPKSYSEIRKKLGIEDERKKDTEVGGSASKTEGFPGNPVVMKSFI